MIHHVYLTRCFCFQGSIQRWPVTSLHPFGSIEREIGWMGELPVHSKALMSDHHLKDIEFTSAVLQESSTIPNHATPSSPQEEHGRLDLRSLHVFTMDSDGSIIHMIMSSVD